MAELDSGVDALISLIKSQTMEIYTCLQGRIVSYENGRARVSPIGARHFDDGDKVPYPDVHDVPVIWPSFAGGSAFVKGPIRPGDKCLLVFAQSAIDGTDDRRTHDLSDAQAVMCDLGSVNGKSVDNDSMMLAFGESFVKVSEAGDIELCATGSIKFTAPKGIESDTPMSHTNGNISADGGLAAKMGMTTESSIHAAGEISSDSDVISQGVSGLHHIHGGVQGGQSNTSEPKK